MMSRDNACFVPGLFSWLLVVQCSCFDKQHQKKTFLLTPRGWWVLVFSHSLRPRERTISTFSPFRPADAPFSKIRSSCLIQGRALEISRRGQPPLCLACRKWIEISSIVNLSLWHLFGGEKGRGWKEEVGHILKPFCSVGIKQMQKKRDKIGLDYWDKYV